MNLYLISQSVNNGYDTYSDAVVCAATSAQARKMHPSGNEDSHYLRVDWAKPKYVKTKLLGIARSKIKPGVVCASFHAG